MTYSADFEKALQFRPPNIKQLFPNSKALIVSGKVIDRAMRAKGKAMAMACNGRNYFVVRGALRGRPARPRRPHHRDRQVGRRAEGVLRRQLLEHGAHRRCPVQRDGHHRARSRSTRTITASRATRTSPPRRSRYRRCSRPGSPQSPSTLRICPTIRTCSPTSS